MISHSPNIIGTWRIKWLSRALANPLFSIGISIILVISPWFGAASEFGLINKDNFILIAGSIVIFTIVIVVFLPVLLRIARYSILFHEIKVAIDELPIDEDTCILGAGGGSFHAIGMIQKAWQEKRSQHNPPSSICVSLMFKKKERHFIPSLNELENIINKKKILIVVAEIGSGITASKIISWAKNVKNIEEVNIFSLIMSETTAKSGDWNEIYTLGIINRRDLKKSVLPWIRTTNLKK